MRNPWLARAIAWLVSFAVGMVFGVAGTIAHPSTWGVLPVGMLLAGIACTALMVSLRLLTGDRWAALSAGVGMLAALAVFSGRGPGGSVVVPMHEEGAFPFGYVWTYLLAGIVLLVVAWPDMSRIRRATSSSHVSG